MIPQLLLEEILLGEKDAKKYYAKYGKERLESALADLRKSNQEILAAYPDLNFKPNIVSMDEKAGEKRDGSNAKKTNIYARLNKAKPIFFAAAAVLALAICAPVMTSKIKALGGSSSIRLKGSGHHQIRLYKQDGAEAVLLKNGEAAKENDLVQITYIPGSYNYGVIFSVDGNGNITRHFPEASWQAEKLQKTGEEVPLSFAYQLDDAPKYECFIFVASKNPFDFSKIESVDKKDFSVDFLKKGSYLPKDCDGAIFILNKK
ncbi:MAG: hypothetical protein IK094_00880 [Treponema sp.]|nr:hypothetical protein [Treponema sp.]